MEKRIDIPSTVKSLKDAFRSRFAGHSDLRSLFLIGSCAGDEDELHDWYQDFDIHSLYDAVFLTPDQLDRIKENLQAICAEFSNDSTAIDWGLRDRHWKLVPDPTKPLNLSVHATLANSLDYQRRIFYNPVLGWNMYQLCEVLLGDHPGKILPPRQPTPLEHVHSAGGVGWMIENFYRALWLLFTEPNEQQFFPHLSGYCWNVASSVALQFYTLSTGQVTTRKKAQDFLLTETRLPEDLRPHVENLAEFKRTPRVDQTTARELVNSAAVVTEWMAQSITSLLNITLIKPSQEGIIYQRDLYSDLISQAIERPVSVQEVHYWIGEGDGNFYDRFGAKLSEIRAQFPNCTSTELPEAIQWLIDKGHSEMTKIYIWSDWNIGRYLLSSDFDFSRGTASLHSALWGWEGSCQSFVQRMHETYITRGINEQTLLYSRALTAIAREQFRRCGLDTTAPGRGFFDYTRTLSEIARTSVIER